MHAHLTDVFTLLDESHAALRAAVDAVPPAARLRKPAPGQWSVAEVLEHLALVDGRFAVVIGAAIAQARQAGLGAETAAREPLDASLRARISDRAEKRQAPEISTPTGRLDAETAWTAMEQAHREFRRVLQEADGLALSQVRATHPRWGELTAYQYAELMAGHEKRHAAQIREMATAASG